MNRLHLTAPSLTIQEGQARVSCTLSMPGRESQQLWIEAGDEGVTDRADAFVALSLLPAMKLGVPLVSDAPVSRSLLEDGLPQIQRIHRLWRQDRWNQAHPDFQLIDLVADAIDDRDPGEAVGCFYSGGVDSSFSLVEATDEITDLLFISHFECEFPADQDQLAVDSVRRVAASRGKRVIVARSNARGVFGEVLSWQHYHGSFMAGIALQFQDRLRTVHVPSSYSIKHLIPWGSHPCLDPLWSTKALAVVHDRIDVNRLDKTAVIAEDRVLMENLRVCWKPVHNCGTCPKCVRTLLTLQVLDRYEWGLPFQRPPITPADLARMDLREGYVNYLAMEMYLADTGRDPDMLAALRTAHRGWYHTPIGSLFRGDLNRRVTVAVRRKAWRLLSATGTLDVVRRGGGVRQGQS